MKLLVCDDDSGRIVSALRKLGHEVNERDIILIDDQGETEMGSLNRSLLAAALASGVVVANMHGQQVPAHLAARTVENFDGVPKRRGKGNGASHKPSNAAALKRASRKRRNIRARASKRA